MSVDKTDKKGEQRKGNQAGNGCRSVPVIIAPFFCLPFELSHQLSLRLVFSTLIMSTDPSWRVIITNPSSRNPLPCEENAWTSNMREKGGGKEKAKVKGGFTYISNTHKSIASRWRCRKYQC